MNILEVKNLNKKYDSNTVVNNINFTLEKGKILGFLGPNGAGKSTTISMITGLVSPTSGEIIFEEKLKGISSFKEHIGLVPQDFALYFDLTAEENVSFFCGLYGFKGKELKNRVKRALEFVGLSDVKKKRARDFSGGMKRRLNIACAIAHTPKLIIMDEPTVGVDPQSRNHILESVKKLKEDGATIIYTSHYMEEIEEICDVIAIMDHGNIIAEGTSSQLKNDLNNDNIISIELSKVNDAIIQNIEKLNNVEKVSVADSTISCYYKDNDHIIEDLVSTISKSDCTIKNIRNEIPSLETVFLSLTGKSLRD